MFVLFHLRKCPTLRRPEWIVIREGNREQYWAHCHSARVDYCITAGKTAIIYDHSQTSPPRLQRQREAVPDGGSSRVWKVTQSWPSKSVALVSSAMQLWAFPEDWRRWRRQTAVQQYKTLLYWNMFLFFILSVRAVAPFVFEKKKLSAAVEETQISGDDWIFLVDATGPKTQPQLKKIFWLSFFSPLAPLDV